MYNADSIKFDKKSEFKTAGGRVVYGGGGITPDVFVGRDTSYYSNYLFQLTGKNVLREYAFTYAQDNKNQLTKQKFNDFLKNFNVSESMLGDLNKLAVSAGVKIKDAEFIRSKNYVRSIIKAYIARQIWNQKANNGLNNEFYQVMASTDETLQKALRNFDKADRLARGEVAGK